MTYECLIDSETYKCKLDLLSEIGPYEFNLEANGYKYHIVIGKHQNGNFICIPNWKIGTELAGFSDVFWNSESLSEHLGYADALCVAEGIKLVAQFIN